MKHNQSKFNELILPYIDLIYFDLKILNPELHAQYCQVSNQKILENFEDLLKKNKEILPRIPLIPNITDTPQNLTGLVEYLRSLNIRKIALLPYNPLWLPKPEKIGIKPLYTNSKWLSNKKKEEIKAYFSDFDHNDI